VAGVAVSEPLLFGWAWVPLALALLVIVLIFVATWLKDREKR
jgi:hypothetical protein